MSSGFPFVVMDADWLDADWRQTALACGCLLVPAALLCSMFCGRLGVERGRVLTGGILPGLLVFGAVMFAAGWSIGFTPEMRADAPAEGWLLLAAFAVLRAEPPAPVRAGIGWTLAAGAMGALGFGRQPDILGSVGGLGLYVWWSAGWQRALGFALAAVATAGVMALTQNFWWFAHAIDGVAALTFLLFVAAAWLGDALRHVWMPPATVPVAEPETPGRIPMATARRIINGLVFLAWMGVPALLDSFIRHERTVQRWETILLPLSLAAGLMLTSGLERRRKPVAG